MRLIKSVPLILLLFCSTLPAQDYKTHVKGIPNPRKVNSSWVLDQTNILGSRKAEINQMIDSLEQQTGVEIAVVVLPSIGELVPKDYAVELFNYWGVGKKDKDNGVLILHVLDQRRIEIETGYGIEPILTDGRCGWLLDTYAIPYFKKKNFADGLYYLTKAMIINLVNEGISHGDILKAMEGDKSPLERRTIGIKNETKYSPKPSTPPLMIPLSGLMSLLSSGIIGFVGLFLLIAWGMLCIARSRRHKKDPKKQFDFYSSIGRFVDYPLVTLLGTLIFILPNKTWLLWLSFPLIWMVTHFFRIHLLKILRDKPRICSCGNTMKRLDEQADDECLDKGQRVEEKIRSIDYDVWICSCGNNKVESYVGKVRADKCRKCKYYTFVKTSERIIRAATTYSSGLKEQHWLCKNCGYKRTERIIIPEISTDHDSSSSSGRSGLGGGSSSGGSFGGGSSGGGGAGRSY